MCLQALIEHQLCTRTVLDVVIQSNFCTQGLMIGWRGQVTMLLHETRASLVAQTVINLPGMQEMRIRSLGWENPLEKGMATHSSILFN